MKISRDHFRIESGARSEDGTKLEPEQQAVQHVMHGTTPVEISAPGVNKVGHVGSVPLEIVAHSDAATVSRSVSALCGNCRYWSQKGWQKMIADADRADASPGEKHSVQEIRTQLLINMPDAEEHQGGDGDYDVEHAMKSMGLCPALREFYKSRDKIDEPYGTFATAGCPSETCTPDRPQGFFVPRDGDARRASAASFDAVMMRAAGKVVVP